jgi:hypothetical protein
MQPIYFTAVWFDHLHQYCSSDPQGAERHLRQVGLGEWVPAWRQAIPYLRKNLKWSDGEDVTNHRPRQATGVIGGKRFREYGVWLAARAAVGYLLSVGPKTLQRRIRDHDHFGEGIRERHAQAKKEYGPTLKKLAIELAASF